MALIVVGSAAGIVAITIGSKKGYDFYKLKSAAPVSVQNNPFYQEKKMEWDNPLYDEDIGMRDMKDDVEN